MTPAGLRGVINDAVAIFLDAALAAAFVSRWCDGSKVKISDGASGCAMINRRRGSQQDTTDNRSSAESKRDAHFLVWCRDRDGRCADPDQPRLAARVLVR